MSESGKWPTDDEQPEWPPAAPTHSPPPSPSVPPSPPLPLTDSLIESNAVVAARFCPSCGASWQADWWECQRCSSASASADANRIESEKRPRANLAGPFTLYFLLLGSLAVMVALSSENTDEAANSIMAFDIGTAILVIFWALIVGSKGMGPLKVSVKPTWLLAMLPVAVGTFIFAYFSMTALTYAFDIPEEGITDLFFDAGFGWTAVILLICVQPAIIEELAFRGVILHGLRGAMSDREAIIVSSLMFAILHLNLLGIPYLFVVGATAGWIRIKSGSLLPCMLLHFCHNFLVIAQEAGWLGF